MQRYLRLYLHFLRFSFSRAMEFRLDFLFRIVMDLVFYAVSLAFFSVIYRHTQLMGGWNYDQVLVFTCGYFVVNALQMSIVSNNMWVFPYFVNRGDLDYYLVRPVSTLFFVSLRDFAADSFVNLLAALGLLAWALARYPGELGAGSVLVYLLLLVNGTLLYYLLHMLFNLPVFWLHHNEGLQGIFYHMTEFMNRPDRIFTGLGRLLFTTILPLALVASYPARILFEGADPVRLLELTAVTLGLSLLLAFVWRQGLRAYASASS